MLLLVCASYTSLVADEPGYIRSSARARGMGNAFVAVADDTTVLFQNPAGLEGVNSNRLELLSAGVSYNDSSEQLLAAQDSLELFSQLIGKKIYADADLGVASLVGPSWGYSVFTGGLLDIEIHNPTLPYFDVNAFYQTGLAYGESSKWSESIDWGYTLKYVSRDGYVDVLHVSEIVDVDDLEKKFSEKGVFGLDVGMMVHFLRKTGFETKIGLVARNIGGLNFGKSGGKIPATYDSGIATTVEIGEDSLLIAIDRMDFTYKGTEYKSTKRNLKMGLEYSLGPKQNNGHSRYAVRLGRNGEYDTYGFSLNFWGVKLDYANWGEEWGRFAGDKKDNRQSFQLSLVFTWGAGGSSQDSGLSPNGNRGVPQASAAGNREIDQNSAR